MIVTNVGPIASIEMPPGWRESAATACDIPRRLLRTFHPEETSEIDFSFFYRGRDVRPADGKIFLAALRQPPHALSDQEIRNLTFVLLNMGDNQYEDREQVGRPPAFIVKLAETGVVNDKKVLVVQGTFQKPTGEPINESINILVDVEGTGRTVFEIFLVVPSSLGDAAFQRYLLIFRQTIGTIKWHNQLEMSQVFKFDI